MVSLSGCLIGMGRVREKRKVDLGLADSNGGMGRTAVW